MSAAFGGIGLAVAVLFAGQGVAQTEATAEIQVALSEAHYAIGRRDCPRAVKHLSIVLAASPERVDAHRLAGDCLMKMDQPVDALPHYREWARLQPGDAEASAAVERAAARERAIEERRAAREREKETVKRALTKPSLGAVARRSKATGPYTVAADGEATASELASASQKRVVMLDNMRERAETVLRPAMAASTDDARQLDLARRRLAEACRDKASANAADGVPRTWSEWAQTRRWRADVQEPTEECRTLAADIARLTRTIGSALAGCEAELSKPPLVYRNIREEVFTRLQAELW